MSRPNHIERGKAAGHRQLNALIHAWEEGKGREECSLCHHNESVIARIKTEINALTYGEPAVGGSQDTIQQNYKKQPKTERHACLSRLREHSGVVMIQDERKDTRQNGRASPIAQI